METRHGVKGAEYEGVFFTEGTIVGASPIRHLFVEISRQNANLRDVKSRLVSQARGIQANGLMNFRYGQRSHPWWKLVLTFKWDTESWYGEGDAVRLDSAQ